MKLSQSRSFLSFRVLNCVVWNDTASDSGEHTMYEETNETSYDDDLEAVEQTLKMGAGTILLFVLFAIVGSLLYPFVLAPLLGTD